MVKCCAKCFKSINELDKEASEIWLELCFIKNKLEYTSQIFINLGNEGGLSKRINLLENMRFITTTECNDNIKVRVEGFLTKDDECVFCIKIHEHLEEDGMYFLDVKEKK